MQQLSDSKETSIKIEDKKKQPDKMQDEMSNYWPVFKRDDPKNKNSSFWQKGECTEFDESDEPIMEGVLSRIGKKSKQVKNYFYRLYGDVLVYYNNSTDSQYKGYLKLDRNVGLERKSLKGKKEFFHYLEFSKDSNMRKLYTNNIQIIEQWFSELRTKCILTKFTEYYKSVQTLGSGSFATVYQVIRTEDQQVFAAKIYEKSKIEENKYKDKFIQMIYNEYDVLKNIEHPCIGGLYEVFQEQDRVVFIMEHVGGGEVYGKLKQLKRFSEQQAAEVIKNVADALYFLHHNEYVHRDLKLENILLVDKDKFSCKLIDFGFAEKINREKLVSKAGTPGFLPPELFYMRPYTDKGDIFSLGVMLFCMISGQSPFKGKTYKEVLENNKKCNVSYDGHSVWQRISDPCKEILKRMLERNPLNRARAIDVLRSEWIQKHFPCQPTDDEFDNKTQKSIKTDKKKMNGDNNSIDSYIQDTEQLDTSTLINMRGESEYPKSLYKKSFISQKNIGSKQQISSHSNKDGGSQKQFEEHEDEEEKKDLQQKFDDADVTAQESSNNYNIGSSTLQQKYIEYSIQANKSNKKLITDLQIEDNICDIDFDEAYDLTIQQQMEQINKFSAYQKKFIQYSQMNSLAISQSVHKVEIQ